MVPVVAHKGINSFRCRINGHAAHSSLTPKGCNAIVSKYLIPEMQKEAVDASVEIEPINCIPAFQTSEDIEILKAIILQFL